MLLTEFEARAKYGPITGGSWPGEARFCVSIPVPLGMGSNWISSATQRPVSRLYVNRDMADPLVVALQAIRDQGLLAELKTLDGTFCVRDVRGYPGRISTHSYALAIDLNAAENVLGTEGSMHPSIVRIFEDAGFVWGKRFARKDPMHFQWAAW
jgi:hypothetical protein